MSVDTRTCIAHLLDRVFMKENHLHMHMQGFVTNVPGARYGVNVLRCYSFMYSQLHVGVFLVQPVVSPLTVILYQVM